MKRKKVDAVADAEESAAGVEEGESKSIIFFSSFVGFRSF